MEVTLPLKFLGDLQSKTCWKAFVLYTRVAFKLLAKLSALTKVRQGQTNDKSLVFKQLINLELGCTTLNFGFQLKYQHLIRSPR